MRKTREGTVKAQNAAIYRKADVSGRSELLSLFIDELAAGIPLDGTCSDAADVEPSSKPAAELGIARR